MTEVDAERSKSKGSDCDTSSTEQGEEVYQVEKILSKRKTSNGVEYLIKWKGYDDSSDNTWEPKENCQCPDLIREYEAKVKNKGGDESRKRKGGSVDAKNEVKLSEKND